MPSLLRRRLYAGRKPPRAAVLNRQHRDAQGLLSFFPMWEMVGVAPRDLVAPAGTWNYFGSGYTWIGSEVGPALRWVGGGDDSTVYSDTFPVPTTSATVALWVRCRDITDANGTLDTRNNISGTAAFKLWLPFAGTLYWDFGGGSGSNRINWTPATNWFGQWHRVMVTAGTAGMAMYNDGVLVASSSTPVTRTTADGLEWARDFIAGNSNRNDYAAWAIWGREYTPGEAAAWARAPLALLEPPAPHQRWWILVSGSASVTVTPSTLALTLALNAATVSGAATITPSALALTLATAAPTVTGGATISPSAQALTLAAQAPTPSGGATLAPSALALTLTTQAPTLTGGATVTPTAQALTLGLPAPSVSAGGDVTVSPAVLALTLAVVAPTITGGAGITVTPAAVALTLSVAAVTVTGGARVTPSALALTLAILAPFLGEARDITLTAGAATTGWSAGAATTGWAAGKATA